ncbi:hypothetical protein [Streptomyces sp. NPDC017988]|uniref:hypothetical protein n=1 Tax=Streptomyces sp. NPDC017988 TaxID=3365025 RepID=UPI0037BB7833
MSNLAMVAVVSAYNLRFIRYWDAEGRIVGNAGPKVTRSLPGIPGLRMFYDQSDVHAPHSDVNEVGRLVVEAFGLPCQDEMRWPFCIYLADAEGAPVDMPPWLRDRIQDEVSRARAATRA